MPNFAPEELEQHAVGIFKAAGASAKEALIVGRHLVEANLAGHDSHGVLRIPQYVEAIRRGKVKVGTQPEIVTETATTAVLDGRNGFGQVIAHEAMALAIRKARGSGIAAVTARNSNHTGRLASYTKMAAAEGLVAMMMVNAGGGGQSVVPFGGLARRLATNPISIAAPSGNGVPVVLDIASSVAPEGKVRLLYQARKPAPPGWLIDSAGRTSTDPKDFYESPGGGLLPLGGPAGYKGFGLAFMIDILAGALSGAGCCRPGAPEALDGFLMLTVDVQKFTPIHLFCHHVALLADHVKSCPPAPGFDEVYVPGEVELREEKRRKLEGIPVDDVIWREIEAIAVELGLGASAGGKVLGPGDPSVSKVK